MNIYTYYVPALPDQEPLLDLWQQSWKKHGWTPVILTEDDASMHPRYDDFLAAIRLLPTNNGVAYETACYLRWLAMAMVGGWSSDYDIMNVGFEPQPPTEELALWCDNNPCPCVMSGSRNAYTKGAHEMMNAAYLHRHDEIINGKPHTSDQNLCQQGYVKFLRCDVVREYPNISTLVHCSAGAVARVGKTKLEAMKELV
jgi:hypothetical protein